MYCRSSSMTFFSLRISRQKWVVGRRHILSDGLARELHNISCVGYAGSCASFFKDMPSMNIIFVVANTFRQNNDQKRRMGPFRSDTTQNALGRQRFRFLLRRNSTTNTVNSCRPATKANNVTNLSITSHKRNLTLAHTKRRKRDYFSEPINFDLRDTPCCWWKKGLFQ
jgi:hypothetical protein